MSMDNELPQQWAERLIARGFTDRRSTTPRPSLGALAEATGLHISTLSSAITGKRQPSMGTVNRLVKALGADVAEWLDLPRMSPWTPPAAASLLTDRQRKAIDELILAMTEQKAGEGHVPASTTPAVEAPDHTDDPGLPEDFDLAADTSSTRSKPFDYQGEHLDDDDEDQSQNGA